MVRYTSVVAVRLSTTKVPETVTAKGVLGMPAGRGFDEDTET